MEKQCVKCVKYMPYKSQAQRKYMHLKHPEIAKRWDREFPNQKRLPLHVKHKKKPKIVVNNKMEGFGSADVKTGKIQINVKRHKGDKRQLADSVKHEIYHLKHPQASEKATMKNTGKLENMSSAEQNKLIAKLRMKKINYKQGVTKRKLKMKGNTKPGDLISKVNESPRLLNTNRPFHPKQNLAVHGMV